MTTGIAAESVARSSCNRGLRVRVVVQCRLQGGRVVVAMARRTLCEHTALCWRHLRHMCTIAGGLPPTQSGAIDVLSGALQCICRCTASGTHINSPPIEVYQALACLLVGGIVLPCLDPSLVMSSMRCQHRHAGNTAMSEPQCDYSIVAQCEQLRSRFFNLYC